MKLPSDAIEGKYGAPPLGLGLEVAQQSLRARRPG